MCTSGVLAHAPDLLDISSLFDAAIVEDAIDQLVMRPETNKDNHQGAC